MTAITEKNLIIIIRIMYLMRHLCIPTITKAFCYVHDITEFKLYCHNLKFVELCSLVTIVLQVLKDDI